MNKLLLKLVMLFSGVWKGMGADTEQLRAILGTRLMLDDRKPLSFGNQRKKRKNVKYASIVGVVITLMIGAFYVLPLLIIKDRVFALTIYWSLVLLLMVITLVTDFSNALFDTRDKYVILPRPINDQTILLSRTLYIFIYLFRSVFPLVLPGWITVGLSYGWPSAVLFIVPVMLMTFMSLFFVIGIYMLIIRLAKPGKFKEIINYFQIVFSVVFFASIYLMQPMLKSTMFMNLNLQQHPGIRFAPSFWLASCWSWVGFPVAVPGGFWWSVCAVLFPIMCIWLVLKILAPRFTQVLATIDNTDGGETVTTTQTAKASSGRFYIWLANTFNKSSEAKAGFIITWLQTARSRTFKMRVYPLFAYVPVYFVYLLTMGNESISDNWKDLPQSSMFLVLLYMCSVVVTQSITYLAMSEQYKAAWVYYASPLGIPGKVIMGAFKALWVKYLLPFFGTISLFVLWVWGLERIFDILLALTNITLLAVIILRIGFRYLPFSIVEQMNQGGGRIVKMIVVMFVPIALGFGHYAAINMLWLKILFLVLSGILLWLVWDSCYNTTWAQLRNTDNE